MNVFDELLRWSEAGRDGHSFLPPLMVHCSYSTNCTTIHALKGNIVSVPTPCTGRCALHSGWGASSQFSHTKGRGKSGLKPSIIQGSMIRDLLGPFLTISEATFLPVNPVQYCTVVQYLQATVPSRGPQTTPPEPNFWRKKRDVRQKVCPKDLFFFFLLDKWSQTILSRVRLQGECIDISGERQTACRGVSMCVEVWRVKPIHSLKIQNENKNKSS